MDNKLVFRIGCLLPLSLLALLFIVNFRFNKITDEQISQIDKLAERHATKEEVVKLVGRQHGGSDDDDFWIYWTWAHFDPLKLGFSDGKLIWVSF